MDSRYQPTELTSERAAELAERSLATSLEKVRGLAEGDDEALAEFEAQVKEAIAKAEIASDPRCHQYIRRLDTGHVVKSQNEYEFCQREGVSLGLMSYNQAIGSINKQIGDNRKWNMRKQKRKVTKAARRRNRKG